MKSTVMEKIIKLNTIKDYNDFLGDLEKIAPLRFEYKEAEKEVIVTRKKEDSRLMH